MDTRRQLEWVCPLAGGSARAEEECREKSLKITRVDGGGGGGAVECDDEEERRRGGDSQVDIDRVTAAAAAAAPRGTRRGQVRRLCRFGLRFPHRRSCT